jgi:hypothetical protein
MGASWSSARRAVRRICYEELAWSDVDATETVQPAALCGEDNIREDDLRSVHDPDVARENIASLGKLSGVELPVATPDTARRTGRRPGSIDASNVTIVVSVTAVKLVATAPGGRPASDKLTELTVWAPKHESHQNQ